MDTINNAKLLSQHVHHQLTVLNVSAVEYTIVCEDCGIPLVNAVEMTARELDQSEIMLQFHAQVEGVDFDHIEAALNEVGDEQVSDWSHALDDCSSNDQVWLQLCEIMRDLHIIQ